MSYFSAADYRTAADFLNATRYVAGSKVPFPVDICHHDGHASRWGRRWEDVKATRFCIAFDTETGDVRKMTALCARHAAIVKRPGFEWSFRTRTVVIETTAFAEAERLVAECSHRVRAETKERQDARAKFIEESRDRVAAERARVKPTFALDPEVSEPDEYGHRSITLRYGISAITPGEARWLSRVLLELAEKAESVAA